MEIEEPKFLVIKPNKGKALKFDLLFLFKVHRGWSSRTCKLVPKSQRGQRDVMLSLEGKEIVDLACVGVSSEDARYDREEFAMCFEMLQAEMNSTKVPL